MSTSALEPDPGEPSPAAPASAPPTVPPAPAGTSAASAPAPASPTRSRTPPKAAGPGKAQDRIELDTTQITGNRELPKVLVIVPWKRAELGDLLGKPVNSLVDEVLQPIDRDVFRRQNRYYRALQPDAAGGKPGGTGAEAPH